MALSDTRGGATPSLGGPTGEGGLGQPERRKAVFGEAREAGEDGRRDHSRRIGRTLSARCAMPRPWPRRTTTAALTEGSMDATGLVRRPRQPAEGFHALDTPDPASPGGRQLCTGWSALPHP